MAMTGGTAKLVKTSTLGDTSATCKLYVYYKTSQDVANNKSTITCGMYVVVSSGYYIGSWSDTGGSYVGTTSLTFSGAIPSNTGGTYWLVENKSFTVNHNADGTGSATIKWKWGVNSSWGGMVMPSGDFTITLPTIARKSTVSATNANIGSKPTITISRKSSSFKHTLQYKINGESSYTTIVSKTDSTSYSSWAIPDAAYNYISSGKVTITIKCITYSGSTKVGEDTTTLTATCSTAGISTVSAKDASIGNATTISITRKSNKLSHTLQYKIGSQSSYTTIVSKTTSASQSWTIPESAYNYISSGKVTVTIKCITYSDSTKIGEKTTTFTASAKAASTVSATSANIGAKPTITITRNSSSFKHTLQYKISGQSSYTSIVSKTDSTSYKSWAIPTAAYDYVSSTAKSVSITINCITYYGDVKIGEKTTTLTANCVEADCKPVLAPTVVDTGSTSTNVTKDENKMIKGFNVMKCTFGITLKYGATVKSKKVTCGDKSRTSDGGLNHCTSDTFTFTVTDSRGYTTTATVKKTLLNYVALTCNLSAKASLESGADTTTAKLDFTISGNWYNGTLGATTNTLVVEYTTDSGKNWKAVTATKSGNTYSYSGSITGLDYEKSHTIQARAYDALYTCGGTEKLVTTNAVTVKAKPIFDWDADDFNFNVPTYFSDNAVYNKDIIINNGKTVYFKSNAGEWRSGIGMNSANNLVIGYTNYNKSDGDTYLDGNKVNILHKNGLTINNSALVDFVVEQGTSDGWTYRKWNSGVGECWKTITHKTKINTAWGSFYTSDTKLPRQSYPFTFTSKPVEQVTLNPGNYTGWIYPAGSGDGVNGGYQSAMYCVIRPTAVTSEVTFYFHMYVVGKYK